ncbi:helix-turn-helix transcriptional regulator, partial [Microbacterium sp. Bi98]|uniref:helix-turn-helix domain-containing protein n=1 Tax=Microbacterium sp. Bi98 TaxID=2821116 RepID=UPI001E6211DC
MTLMDNPTWTLEVRLRKSRIMADLEQAQIAEAIGVSRNTVSNWETGRSEPSATFFVRWAQATGVTLDWLAEGLNAGSPAASATGLPGGDVRPKGLEPLTF